jgi:alpha-glucosidase
MFMKGLAFLGYVLPSLAISLESRQSSLLDKCPGYTASNVQNDGSTVTADLTLAGTACNAYGEDLTKLKLLVEYQTGTLHYSLVRSAILIIILITNRTATSRKDLR